MKYEIITELDCKFCRSTKVWEKKTSYLYRVAVAFDQLGNTLAGGDPDVPYQQELDIMLIKRRIIQNIFHTGNYLKV